MPAAPRVTVLMTTYNGERYIAAAIASILAQTFRDFELVILDDASTDATPAIVGAFGDPRLRFIRSARNGGVVASRNAAVAFATGDYVATIDHDDLWEPEKLAEQVAFLDASPDAVAVTCVARELRPDITRSRPSTRPVSTDPIVLEWLLHTGNPLVFSCLMFRRSALAALGAFMAEDAIYADDYDLYHRLLALGPIVQLSRELATYRYHAANTAKQVSQVMQRNAAHALARSLAMQQFHRVEEWVALGLTRHAGGGEPLRSAKQARQFLTALDALRWHFVARRNPGRMTDGAFTQIDGAIAACRLRLFRTSLRTGHLAVAWQAERYLSRDRVGATQVFDLAVSFAIGSVRALAHAVARARRPSA